MHRSCLTAQYSMRGAQAVCDCVRPCVCVSQTQERRDAVQQLEEEFAAERRNMK